MLLLEQEMIASKHCVKHLILTPLTRDIRCENVYLGHVSQSSDADVKSMISF